jgi:UDP-N-acetylglucosamine enolpyruvyl transferase
MLEDLGATVLTPELHTQIVTAKNVEILKRQYELVKTNARQRSGFRTASRTFRSGKVSLPGGCAIGTRPD